MKRIKYYEFFVVIFSIFQFLNAQKIEIIRSQNKDFFMYNISYEFDSNIKDFEILDTVNKNNKIVVFNSDSLIKYEIPRSFDITSKDYLFLSNNGDYIIHIFDGFDEKNKNSIEIYERGILKNSIKLHELINIDTNWEAKLLFSAYKSASFKEPDFLTFDPDVTEFERKITKNPCRIFNDTIFIYTQTNELLLIDIKSGKFKKESFNYINKERLDILDPENCFRINYNNSIRDLIFIKNIDFDQSTADCFNMKIDTANLYYYYKNYSIYLGLLIDSKGNANIYILNNRNSLDKIKIISFIDSINFSPFYLPKGVDYYLVEKNINLIPKDLKKARIEKIQSDKEKIHKVKKSINTWIKADTLNGIYIPVDLNDCFKHIDSIISKRDLESIKNFEYCKESDFRYIGLSIWIKDNWIIGPGTTRLSSYFNKKGIKNEDEMTSIVVDSYYKYLRNENVNERKIFRKIKSEKRNNPKIKTVNLIENNIFDPLQADSINGKYIPKNLKDCFHYLDEILSEKDILALKNNEIIENSFFSIGFCNWVDTNLMANGFSRLSFDILINNYYYRKNEQCLILEKYKLYLQIGMKNIQ
jgi:hypothetical protein